jgi:hypothetical protein
MNKCQGFWNLLILFFTLLLCPGWSLAQGILSVASSSAQIVNFPSSPLVVESKGMGNAVVADGTLFNATAFNPALLANNPDFAEIHFLNINLGNDIVGIANYATNSNSINNLQNSLQNINHSFQNINNALGASGGVNVNQFNNGINGLNNAIADTQTAVSNLTNKSIQLGLGAFNCAFKFDDHWGFQIYDNVQMALQVGRGQLVDALLSVTPLPQLTSSTGASTRDSIVGAYNSAKSIFNAYLNPAQQTSLQNAVNTLEGSGGSSTDISNFATTVNNIMSSVDPSSADNALFNKIAPVNVLSFLDLVAMGTYCIRPLADDPALSAGMNFKLVSRRIAFITSSYLINQNTNGSSDISNDIQNDLEQYSMRWGVDLGVLYDFDDPKLALGIAATDILHSSGAIQTHPGDPLNSTGGTAVIDPAPTVVQAGASWKVVRDLTVNCDVADLFNDTSYYEGLGYLSHLDFGFNYNLIGILQLRGGMTNSNLCGGLGLPLGIQYAFAVDTLTQSYNHYLQFDLAF